VVIDGKEVRYCTWLQGEQRSALVDQFKQEYGYGNVRVLTQRERNLLSNNQRERTFGKSYTEALARA
jgi:hypothetical protein